MRPTAVLPAPPLICSSCISTPTDPSTSTLVSRLPRHPLVVHAWVGKSNTMYKARYLPLREGSHCFSTSTDRNSTPTAFPPYISDHRTIRLVYVIQSDWWRIPPFNQQRQKRAKIEQSEAEQLIYSIATSQPGKQPLSTDHTCTLLHTYDLESMTRVESSLVQSTATKDGDPVQHSPPLHCRSAALAPFCSVQCGAPVPIRLPSYRRCDTRRTHMHISHELSLYLLPP